eukprot:976796-Alexandrium_andersonii.AAC.1
MDSRVAAKLVQCRRDQADPGERVRQSFVLGRQHHGASSSGSHLPRQSGQSSEAGPSASALELPAQAHAEADAVA